MVRKKRRPLRVKQQGELMQVSIESIIVKDRFRQDMGDIEGLANSIKELGQIQPIVISKDRRLIAGGRRLAAMVLLGCGTIAASVFDLDDIDTLKVELDENEQRKALTISERVAMAEAVAERLKGRVGNPKLKANSGNISGIGQGETRDLAAAKAGLGSGKKLEAAQKVLAQGAPELVQAMDSKKLSINAAKDMLSLSHEDQASLDYDNKDDLKAAKNRGHSRTRRAAMKEQAQQQEQPSQSAPAAEVLQDTNEPIKVKPDEQRLYSEGSSLSAFVLAARAVSAISQISKNDPNAIDAIEDIQAALTKQLSSITNEKTQ